MATDERIFVALLQIADITDPTALSVSVGTADGTVADVGGSFNQTTLNNNFRDVADKINSLITALASVNAAQKLIIAKQNEVLRAHKRGDGPR